MLWALAAIEFVLWIFALSTRHKMGGFAHVLLGLALLAVVTEVALRLRREHAARRTTSESRPTLSKAA